MMTGFGQFGPIEMGGMFTVMKVREGLAAGDYRDPGWYKIQPEPSPTKWMPPWPASLRGRRARQVRGRDMPAE